MRNPKVYVYFTAVILVLISAIYHGFEAARGLKTGISYLKIIVGLAAIYLAVNRDTYLPFLGQTVYPCSLLADKVPDGAQREVLIQVPAGAKVVYWAAEPGSEPLKVAADPWSAYLKYENAGVVTATPSGQAVLKVREPTSYRVPSGMILKRHIHYRYCVREGMLSPVMTAFIDG